MSLGLILMDDVLYIIAAFPLIAAFSLRWKKYIEPEISVCLLVMTQVL
jgi:hypothetical protein